MTKIVDDFQRENLPEVEERDSQWFIDQLSSVCPELQVRGKELVILCKYHNDSTPSLGVDAYKGYWNCFSCGEHGGWNKLAKTLGLKLLKYKFEDRTGGKDTQSIDDVSRALKEIGAQNPARKEVDPNRPLVREWDPGEDWRGIPGAFLANLGCKKVLDLGRQIRKKEEKNGASKLTAPVTRIALPMKNIDGRLLGYQCRSLEDIEGVPRYTPMHGDHWIQGVDKELPVAKILFLVEKALQENWNTCVIVEGPFDALRLYYAGIPAVATLGAGNWNEGKATLIGALGFNKVYSMMDNDEAGREGNASVKRSMSAYGACDIIALPSSVKDPGDLSPKQLDWVKKKVGL